MNPKKKCSVVPLATPPEVTKGGGGDQVKTDESSILRATSLADGPRFSSLRKRSGRSISWPLSPSSTCTSRAEIGLAARHDTRHTTHDTRHTTHDTAHDARSVSVVIAVAMVR